LWGNDIGSPSRRGDRRELALESSQPEAGVARSTEDEGMASVARWLARLGAVVSAMTLAVFVPVAAWASPGTGEVVAAAARRGGGFSFLGLLCCLVVVGIIVLIVVLLMRRRRGGGR
jgi:Na+/melibiose symporter-like transporter